MLLRGYDLLISSEMHVPGAISVSSATPEQVDLEIRYGSARLSEAQIEEGPDRYAPGELLFEMPALARYLCCDGRLIVVEPAPGASLTDIGDMLVATALPALLWMRGAMVLHAAGIVPDGCAAAIALCGPSGSGKSTVVRDLLSHGGRIVGDDTLRLRVAPSGVPASGLPGRFCWSGEAGLTRVGHVVAPSDILASAPLRCLFVLTLPRSSSGFRFERLQGVGALQAVLAQRHRPRVPRIIGMEQAYLAQFAMLARMEIYSWQRSENSTTLAEGEIAFLADAARVIS